MIHDPSEENRYPDFWRDVASVTSRTIAATACGPYHIVTEINLDPEDPPFVTYLFGPNFIKEYSLLSTQESDVPSLDVALDTHQYYVEMAISRFNGELPILRWRIT